MHVFVCVCVCVRRTSSPRLAQAEAAPITALVEDVLLPGYSGKKPEVSNPPMHIHRIHFTFNFII